MAFGRWVPRSSQAAPARMANNRRRTLLLTRGREGAVAVMQSALVIVSALVGKRRAASTRTSSSKMELLTASASDAQTDWQLEFLSGVTVDGWLSLVPMTRSTLPWKRPAEGKHRRSSSPSYDARDPCSRRAEGDDVRVNATRRLVVVGSARLGPDVFSSRPSSSSARGRPLLVARREDDAQPTRPRRRPQRLDHGRRAPRDDVGARPRVVVVGGPAAPQLLPLGHARPSPAARGPMSVEAGENEK